MSVVLDRIAYDPGEHAPLSIDWPAALAPHDVSAPHGTAQIPYSDVLVITWTVAEARALADVLTPGLQSISWQHYVTNFGAYEPELTGRSPARESHRLGSWAQVTIGSKRVTCFKSELHPATDAHSLPVAQLVQQLLAEVNPQLVVTTGTAGGAGVGTQLGDVNVAASVRSDFTTKLKGNSWSQESWACTEVSDAMRSNLALMSQITPAAQHLPQTAHYETKVWYGDTVSTDFFAYDTQDDHFGLRSYAPEIRAVEMDDAAVALGHQRAGNPDCGLMSIRNASDPVMPDYSPASTAQAAGIYRRCGYWTTVNSAISCWAAVASLA